MAGRVSRLGGEAEPERVRALDLSSFEEENPVMPTRERCPPGSCRRAKEEGEKRRSPLSWVKLYQPGETGQKDTEWRVC